MKKFLVTVLFATSVLLLIIILDVLMGIKINQILPHLRKPFEVPEPAYYFITFLLLGFLLIKPLIIHLLKKGIKPSENK